MPPHGSVSRSRFFRRMGCLLAIFNILALIVIFLVIGLLARWLGVIHLPYSLRWIHPVGIVFFLIGLGFLAWAGYGLRRLSLPLGDLLEAADRVADGDYSVRVREQGPPEVRSLARGFNAMASRLQSTDEHRRSMLADVTHEFRTPLTVIQGNVEGMLDGVYSADETRLKSILEEIQLLSRLVDDLRTLALAESGALQLTKEPTDLAVLIGETLTAFAARAAESGVDLRMKVDPQSPTPEIDPERIHQVLSNLIANALHYTPKGGQIEVRCNPTFEDGQPSVVVAVEDNGAGIPAQDLPHIFDRFYKGRDSGGMGLGLAIARHLVEAHHGVIQAQSEVGKGTVVRVILPVES
jgi:signal transduction histidine kinase